MSAIYFIESVTTGHFKVGFSGEPCARFADIQRHCPVPLYLAAVLRVEGIVSRKHMLSIERQFHERYLEFHNYAEWFRPNPLIVADVAAINAGQFDLSVLPVMLTEGSLLRPVARGPRNPTPFLHTDHRVASKEVV